jgi:hypothetical protein
MVTCEKFLSGFNRAKFLWSPNTREKLLSNITCEKYLSDFNCTKLLSNLIIFVNFLSSLIFCERFCRV